MCTEGKVFDVSRTSSLTYEPTNRDHLYHFAIPSPLPLATHVPASQKKEADEDDSLRELAAWAICQPAPLEDPSEQLPDVCESLETLKGMR